jgi:heterodisulfide reductase subunit C
MSSRVDPNLHRDIAKFGGVDVDACMNCGNCTAICSLSTEEHAFPRRIMHHLQIGNRKKILQSADPWLCYYCGDCSESCPRDANPAETMMAVRRYLTSQYDWTGLAKKLYLSTAWEIGALLLVGLVVVAIFYFFHGPMITERVEINTFAPVAWVELGDLVMAGLLSFFLLTNAYRMYRHVRSAAPDVKVPFSLYVKAIPTFITHFTTQKRWRDHGDGYRWLRHFLLVTGYLTMLTLILVLLRWFQTDVVHPVWHPQRLLGYYATAVLLYATVDMMVSRYRKRAEMHRFTHSTDWMFLILLFLTTLTGIVVHAFRITGFPMLTYYTYVIHLAIAVPMLVVEVPFGKWAHLLYRPLAVFLTSVQERAAGLPHSEPALASN